MTPLRHPLVPFLRRALAAALVGASAGCAWSGDAGGTVRTAGTSTGAGAGAAAADRGTGFCTAPETTWFACPTAGGRQLALCGEAGHGLQYRFGHPPRADLQFPARAEDGLAQMFHAHYFRAGVDRTEIRFTTAGTDYVVFDYTEDGHRRAGVRVATPDGRETEVACRGPITSRLAELGPRLPCDADSALNGGQCPAR